MNSILKRFWLRNGAPAVPAQTRSAGYPLIAFQGPGEPSWTNAASGALLKEGLIRNPVVYRCTRMVSEAAASLPLLLYDDDQEVFDHPLLDLLRQPNAHQSTITLMETLYGHLLVNGNAYVHPVSIEGVARELHLLRPDKIEIVFDDAGWPVAYDYVTNNRRRRFDAGGAKKGLLHVSMFNPCSDFDGLPPLAAANMALDLHNAASRWNKALLDNSARPSGALVYTSAEGANLSQDQFERLKGELEQGYSGSSRAGRPMLLEGGLDWKAMAYSPKDMDFMEARNGAARDIALAFGVPPMLLGIPGDNTYANYSEANRAFWRQTVLPLAARVTSALGCWLGSDYAGQLRLDFDRDASDALSHDREALWKRIGEATFLTVDEKRAAVGYGRADPAFLASGGE